MDHWNLVYDVSVQIFGYCSLNDLKSLSCCSSSFNEQVTELLWKEVCIPAEILDEKDIQKVHATKLSKLVYTKVLRLTDVSIFRGRKLKNYMCILDHCNPDVVDTFIHKRGNAVCPLVLTKTFEMLPNLEKVTISGTMKMVTAFAHVTILKNIRSLDLSNTSSNNEVLQAICYSLYTLELLNLSATKVTSKFLLLLKRLPRLSKLLLSGCEIGDIGASRIAECQHLTALDVSQCYMSNRGLWSLANLTNLTALVVTEMHKVRAEGGNYTGYSDEGVNHLLGLKKLKGLAIGQDEGVTFDSISKLSGLQYLTSLSIHRSTLNHHCLRSLSSLKDLLTLDICTCRGLNDNCIQYLPYLTKLDTLRVSGYFTNSALFHISQIPLLRYLSFRDSVDMADLDNTHDQPGVNDAGLVHLLNLNHLQTLEISANLTSRGFETISEITSLQKLDASFMALNNDAFMYFSRLPNIKSFICGYCGLLDPPSSSANELPLPEEENDEQELHNVENPWQDDADQNDHWNQLPFDEDHHPLERLERVLHLERLEEERVRMMPNNDCMYHVGNMSSLEYLYIKSSPITNDCVPHLKRLQNLSELICIDTGLTAEALAELNVKRIYVGKERFIP